jgi:hypothetical protein
VEQPALLRRFPIRRTSSVGRFLTTEAKAPSTVILPPAPAGPPAAASAVSLAAAHPTVMESLARCLTLRPDSGLVRVATLGTEALFRVPGFAGAFFARGRGVLDSSLVYRSDASATVTVTARQPGWLTIAIDDEPGWSASASGRTLATRRSGDFLEVRVPNGRSEVVVTYWPKYLTLGFALAAVALGIGGAAGIVPALWRRRALRRTLTRRPGGPVNGVTTVQSE